VVVVVVGCVVVEVDGKVVTVDLVVLVAGRVVEVVRIVEEVDVVVVSSTVGSAPFRMP